MNESDGTTERLPRSSPDAEALRFRARPCARCRQGLTPISHLIRCQSADTAFRARSIDEKLAGEVAWLQAWVAACPHNEKQFPVVKLSHGSEHNVYLEQQFRECVVKSTLPGLYGDKYYLKDGTVFQQACTPYEYLVRLRLWKKIFGFAPSDVGISESGQIISVQGIVPGEMPSQEEVNEQIVYAALTPSKDLWLDNAMTTPPSPSLPPHRTVRVDLGLSPRSQVALGNALVRATLLLGPISAGLLASLPDAD